MSDTLLAAGYAVLLWWASTGLALLAVGRAPERSRAAVAGAALLLAASLAVLWTVRDDPSAVGQYLAFTAAIGVWGAAEVAFLTGWMTGPWRAACPAGATGWMRAGYALGAVLWHELSLLACGAAVAAVTYGGGNRAGAWCFAILFVMRISAKLNILLGVPNVTSGFLPAHLGYLTSFFANRPMNALFPVSVTAATIALVLVGQQAEAAIGGESVGLALLWSLLALGLLEHWFLVLPIPVEGLWGWGRSAEAAGADRAVPVGEPLAAPNVVRLDARLAARGAGVPGGSARHDPPFLSDRRPAVARPDQAGASP